MSNPEDNSVVDAAQNALMAVSDLLYCVTNREGLRPIETCEVSENLAGALRKVLNLDPRPDTDGTRGQLLGALERFLDGWAG